MQSISDLPATANGRSQQLEPVAWLSGDLRPAHDDLQNRHKEMSVHPRLP